MKRSHSNFLDHLDGRHTDWAESRRNCTICRYLRAKYAADCICPKCGAVKAADEDQCSDCFKFERSRYCD
jgi:hypothetical protein